MSLLVLLLAIWIGSRIASVLMEIFVKEISCGCLAIVFLGFLVLVLIAR
jgi:hypothetical protein